MPASLKDRMGDSIELHPARDRKVSTDVPTRAYADCANASRLVPREMLASITGDHAHEFGSIRCAFARSGIGTA
jgi:hypothetical protein